MLVHAAGPAKATGCGRACELLLAARACAATKIASALPGTTRKPAILTPMNHGLHQNIGPPQQERSNQKKKCLCSFSIIVFAHFISKLAATLDAYNGYGARYR